MWLQIFVQQKIYMQIYYIAEPYEKEFLELGPDADGKIDGAQAKRKLVESKLNNSMLHKIWTLSDIDKDGKLSLYEYSYPQSRESVSASPRLFIL